MTTAARPTFEPARGGQGRNEKDLSAISRQYSCRDLPGHTKLKYREHGQGTVDENRSRDFRRELEDKERELKGVGVPILRAASRPAITSGVGGGSDQQPQVKRPKLEGTTHPPPNLDADDPADEDGESGSEEEEGGDSDDDMAELLAELNRIKKERAAEEAQKEREKRQEEERIRMENILSGNPLLTHYAAGTGGPAGAGHTAGDLQVKRRWDDDVVFKNCARTETKKKGDVFINDSLRSEFHKKFMEKYVK